MMQLNFNKRIFVIVIFTVILTSFGITIGSFNLFSNAMDVRFQEKMDFIGKSAVTSANIGLLLGDKDLLNNIAMTILQDKDIRGVIILDSKGSVIVKHGESQSLSDDGKLSFPVYLVSSENNVIFNPVQEKRLLGKIDIFYTDIHSRKLTTELFVYSILIGLVVAMLMGAFSYSLISRALLLPVNDLLNAVKRVGDGELDLKVETHGLPEVEVLADSFSEMVQSLHISREMLKKTYEEMTYHKTLGELGKFSLIIAHEFKNPLGIIKGSLDIIKKDNVDGETKKLMLNYVEEETIRLDNLVKEFLTISRAKKPEFSSIDPRSYLKNIKDKMMLNFKDKELLIRVSDNMDKLVTDPVLLERILLNLVKNAYEAGADIVNIELDLLDSVIRLRVSDNGAGISDDKKEKIFEPFYTEKKSGSGLGLVYVSQAANALNGRIGVYDNTPKGTVFEIEFINKEFIE